MNIWGVTTDILENGILEKNAEIFIKNFNNKNVKPEINFEKFKLIKDTKNTAKPDTVIKPDIGTTIKLGKILIIEIVLKFKIVIGKSALWAEIVTLKISITFIFIFMFFNKSNNLGCINTIPYSS